MNNVTMENVRTMKLLAMEINWLLFIYGYRRYPAIANPLEAFIIKNRQPIRIAIDRNRRKKRASINWRKYPEDILKEYRQKGTKNLQYCNNPIPYLYSDKGK